MDIIIDPEFATLIPPTSKESRDILEAKLFEEGCRDALIVWKGHGILLDGHTRHEICTRLGIGFQVKEIELADREEAMLWIERHQLGRRNLTEDQRVAMAARIAELASELAKRERATTAVKTREERKDSKTILEAPRASKINQKPDSEEKKQTGPVDKERSRAAAAREAGVSEAKVRAVQEVAKVAPEMVDKIARGEVTIAEAKKATKTVRPAPDIAPAPRVKDKVGRPIEHEYVRAAFEETSKFASLAARLSALKAEFDSFAMGPAATYVARQRQQFNAAIDTAHRSIRFSKPYAVCPYCGGEKCESCHNSGWMGEELYKTVPADIRGGEEAA